MKDLVGKTAFITGTGADGDRDVAGERSRTRRRRHRPALRGRPRPRGDRGGLALHLHRQRVRTRHRSPLRRHQGELRQNSRTHASALNYPDRARPHSDMRRSRRSGRQALLKARFGASCKRRWSTPLPTFGCIPPNWVRRSPPRGGGQPAGRSQVFPHLNGSHSSASCCAGSRAEGRLPVSGVIHPLVIDRLNIGEVPFLLRDTRLRHSQKTRLP